MEIVSLIPLVVGIIGCVIGIATFASAQITKAKQDGMVLAKVDQCVKNTEEIKKEMKERNKELDQVIDNHGRDIVELQTKMKMVFENLKIVKWGKLYE